MSTSLLDFGLQGACCLITGGARGIGRAIRQRFQEAGCIVHILDLNADASSSESQVSAGLFLHKGDASNPDHVRVVLEQIPRLDILINNAASPFYCPFEQLTRQRWEQAFANDLHGVFECVQQALPKLKNGQGPSIVNISSIEAFVAEPGTAAYGSTKGALLQLTRCLAVDLATYGIRVNAIAPGAIAVERNAEIFSTEPYRSMIAARVPLGGRAGEAQDIANAALFLASPLSKYTTGATLVVDGGWLAKA